MVAVGTAPGARRPIRTTASSRANREAGSASSCVRGPCSTMRPWSTTAISSTERNDESRCATRTAVRPVTRRSTARSTSSSVSGSSRLDGSSRITRPGSDKNARGSASSCASPADTPDPSGPSSVSSPAGRAASHDPRPSSSSRRTRSSSGAVCVPNNVRFSRNDARNSCTSWVTIATRRRRSAMPIDRMSTPSSSTSPSSVSYRRSASRVMVLLPLPVRPTSPSECPASMRRSTWSSTSSSP